MNYTKLPTADNQATFNVSGQEHLRPEFNLQNAGQEDQAAASFNTGRRDVRPHDSECNIPEPQMDLQGANSEQASHDKLQKLLADCQEISQELSSETPEASEKTAEAQFPTGATTTGATKRTVAPLSQTGHQDVPAIYSPASYQEAVHQIPTAGPDGSLHNLQRMFVQLGDAFSQVATDLSVPHAEDKTAEPSKPKASSPPPAYPAEIQPETLRRRSGHPESRELVSHEPEKRQQPVGITGQDLRDMKNELVAIINGLPDPKKEISEREKELVALANHALSILEDIEADSHGRLKLKPCCGRDVLSYFGAEVPISLLFYIGATINLAVFVSSASDDEQLKKTLLALGASLSTGPMYLKGFLAFLETISQHTKAISASDAGKSAFSRLANKLSPWFNDPVKAMKGLTFSGIAGMSVYLDAKNSANGITGLSGIPALGTALGIFNGITEAFIPMFQLDETWKCIADPFTAVIRGSSHSKAELTAIAKSLTPLVEKASNQAMAKYLRSLPAEERRKVKTRMNQLVKNERKLTAELSSYLAKQPIKSRTYNLIMFMLQATAISATGILVAGAMSTPEKYGFYSGQLDRCNTTTEMPRELYLNTGDYGSDGTTPPPFDPCQLNEYPLSENTLNHLSYFMMSLGLYPCFLNSFSTAKKAVSMAHNLVRHGKLPSVREVAAVGIATLSATCYAMIILGVRGGINFVQGVEENNGFDTSLVKINDLFLGMTVATIILTLFGGSEAGVTALMERGEKRLFEKNTEDGLKIFEIDDEDSLIADIERETKV